MPSYDVLLYVLILLRSTNYTTKLIIQNARIAVSSDFTSYVVVLLHILPSAWTPLQSFVSKVGTKSTVTFWGKSTFQLHLSWTHFTVVSPVIMLLKYVLLDPKDKQMFWCLGFCLNTFVVERNMLQQEVYNECYLPTFYPPSLVVQIY